jgi:hydroxymethylglutaryl-CoA reductase
MGANFINSCLEQISITFERLINKSDYLNESEKEIKIIMSILSNYTPECLVEASVECDLDKLGNIDGLSAH